MKKWFKTIAFTAFGFFWGCAQKPPAALPQIQDAAFQKKLLSLLDFSVPLIGVEELRSALERKENLLILDAREWEEYGVSHLPGAQFAGFKQFDGARWQELPKDQPVVVYCSVGYRSEKISGKLKKLGFSKVYNLYGSIFEWVNRGYPVVNPQGKTVLAVHTYNEDWSRWVSNPEVKKTW